jgi:nucleoside-diphosphate-sugar epimerase
MRGSRVLVTGADGLIGRAVTEHLVLGGVKVTALSLGFEGDCAADRVIAADARDEAAVEGALEGVDAVVHLAAIPHPTLGTPAEVYGTNVVATFTVLAKAGERGVRRAVVASSVNAFGVPMNSHRVQPEYFPIDEEIASDIDDAYSLSKQSDEATARMVWRRWGTDVVCLRFPLVKEYETLRGIAAEVAGDPGRLASEGWAYLDLRDAVRAVECALTAPLRGPHVVGLSAPDLLLDRPAADLLREHAPDVPVRGRLGEHGPLIDTTRARELLGFEALHSIHRPRDSGDALTLGAANA